MVRVAATLTKKVSIPGSGPGTGCVEAGARLELEAADEEAPEVLRARIRRVYELLEGAIDEQLQRASVARHTSAAEPAPGAAPVPSEEAPPPGRGAPSTQAQRRAVVAICRSHGLDLNAVLKDLGVEHLAQLTVRDASMLIDDLKSRQPTAS